jgi:hypothetical protein
MALTPIQKKALIVKLLGKAGFTDVTATRGITDVPLAIQDDDGTLSLHTDFDEAILFLVKRIIIQRVIAEP